MSEPLSLLPDYSRPTPHMLGRLESLFSGAGVPERWTPTRLIVLNWWQWDYQEFHFGRGWQMLRGQNLAGKSLMLSTIVPFLFDGDKRRYRLDTAGSDARTIAYYLLGAPEATPESDFYYDERIGYAALEFLHPNTQETRTIGMGLHGRRVGDAQPDVGFWGFVLRDGRRIGQGIVLKDPVTDAPLHREAFLSQLGSNPYSDQPAKYQEAVNAALFGYKSLEDFKRAMDITLPVRRPNLHGTMTPQAMCQYLSDSLPELDENVLVQMAGTLEDIDKTKKSIRETEIHLSAARRVDEAVGNYLTQVAQSNAVSLQDAEQSRKRDTGKLERAETELAKETAAHDTAVARIDEINQEKAGAEARKTELERNPAFDDRDRLSEKERELQKAEDRVQRELGAVQQQESAITMADERARRINTDWQNELEWQHDRVGNLREHAESAAWSFADEFATKVVTVLAHAGGPDVDDVPDLSAATLATLGEDRCTALNTAKLAREQVARAEELFDRAKERLEIANVDRQNADEARLQAERELHAARTDASAAMNEWARGSKLISVTPAALNSVLDRIHVYEDPNQDPFTVVTPVRELFAAARLNAETDRASVLLRQKERALRLEAINDELEELKSRKWAVPEPRSGQESVRTILNANRIKFSPLYACVDFKPGTSDDNAAAIEAALTGSSLLDALVVAASDMAAAQRLLGTVAREEAGGDFIATPHTAVKGSSLADVLVPVECDVPAQDITAVLRSISLGDLTASSTVAVDGAWRLGVLSGVSGHGSAKGSQFIGETNRRRLLEAQIARLQAEAYEVEFALEEIAEELASLEQRIRALGAASDSVGSLKQVGSLREAAATLVQAANDLRRKNDAVAAASTEADKKRADLTSRRTDLEGALREVPEAKGRNASGIQDLIISTRGAVKTANEIAHEMKRFARLQSQYADAMRESQKAREGLEQAREFLSQARIEVARVRNERDALKQRLDELGLDEIVDQIKALKQSIEAYDKEREECRQRASDARSAIRSANERISEMRTAVAAANKAVSEAETLLRASLRAYPSQMLLSALKIAEDPAQGLVAAAENLLRYRRAELGRRAQTVGESTSGARASLATAFAETRTLLAEYGPEIDDQSRVKYRHKVSGSMTARGLVDALVDRQAENERTMREKEDKLYEEFFLNELSASIRERIDEAKALTRGINDLLGRKKFAKGSLRFFVRWRAREDKGGDYKKLVALLETDLLVQPEEKVAWVKEFFRKRIAEVRLAEEKKTLETTYAEALREVLDYRKWFSFHVYSAERGEEIPETEWDSRAEREIKEKRLELTGAKFKRGSGAQKALGIFCPLIAAAHVRFSGARPDAPRVIGLDEAFGGVDAANMNEMIRFLVELEFSVVMTSETRWGTSPALPGCTTYDLQSHAGVAAARMWLWDGKVRLADHIFPVAELIIPAVAHATAI